jgi:hypothetical protein
VAVAGVDSRNDKSVDIQQVDTRCDRKDGTSEVHLSEHQHEVRQTEVRAVAFVGTARSCRAVDTAAAAVVDNESAATDDDDDVVVDAAKARHGSPVVTFEVFLHPTMTLHEEASPPQTIPEDR